MQLISRHILWPPTRDALYFSRTADKKKEEKGFPFID